MVYKPTRDGSGSYFVTIAGDPSQYLHLESHSTAENTALEIYGGYDQTHSDTYKWKFEPVNITAPFDSGLHKVSTQKDHTKFLHVRNRSSAGGEHLEILSYNPSYEQFYQWEFQKQEDNTYLIKNVATGKYVHPIGHSTSAGTRLEQLDYTNVYAPYFKWIIAPGSASNTYRFFSAADPTELIHLSNHTASESNEVEILPFNSGYSDAYEWKLE